MGSGDESVSKLPPRGPQSILFIVGTFSHYTAAPSRVKIAAPGNSVLFSTFLVLFPLSTRTFTSLFSVSGGCLSFLSWDLRSSCATWLHEPRLRLRLVPPFKVLSLFLMREEAESTCVQTLPNMRFFGRAWTVFDLHVIPPDYPTTAINSNVAHPSRNAGNRSLPKVYY